MKQLVRPLLGDTVAKRFLVVERRTVFSDKDRIGNFDSQNRLFGFYYCPISPVGWWSHGDFCNSMRVKPT